MTDIVERLRDYSRRAFDGYPAPRRDAAEAMLNAAAVIERLRGAMRADDLRLRIAGERVGIIQGCDLPDWMADEIEHLRAAVKAETEACAMIATQPPFTQARDTEFDDGFEFACRHIAAAIRARMEAKP